MIKKQTAIFEIFLLVSFSFAMSYTLHQSDSSSAITNGGNKEPNLMINILKKFFDILPSVSAAGISISTCINTKDGKSCQEFPSDQCSSQCNGACVPASMNQVDACKLGTCYDSGKGICQVGSPKSLCSGSGITWYDDPNGNIPQCQKGCCVLGNNAAFTTSQECTQRALTAGVVKDYRPEIQNEISCLSIAGSGDQGACTFNDNTATKTCKFTTRSSCSSMQGTFYKNYLCSNPELGTNCIKESKASCVLGKDEIYWFDSCGNQENIYSANKDSSYNNGMILPKNSSCVLSTANNPTANQNICGNCNYLLGSVCGAATSSQKLADSSIGFVCKDLSCTDSGGNKHKNGESWCTYQGSVGVDQTGANARSTDTVGSTDFRETCNNGDIQTESCGDFRTGICVQSSLTNGQSSFSSAACRANHAVDCLNYNIQNQTALCAQNPDCFLKHVEVSSNYKFDLCAPRYPIGLDVANDPQGAQTVCSFASQSCTVVRTKTLFGGWKITQNAECESAKFAEQMNNLCMSLGDCGEKVSYQGSIGEGYSVVNAPKLGQAYISGISAYKNSVSGQTRAPGDNFFGSASLGVPDALGSASTGQNAAFNSMLKTSGAAGTSLAALAWVLPHVLGPGQIISFFAGAGAVSGGIGAGGAGINAISATAKVGSALSADGFTVTTSASGGTVTTTAVQEINAGVYTSSSATANSANLGLSSAAAHPTLAAMGGATAGAAIGASVTAILIKAFHLEGGLGNGLTNALVITGAAAGAVIGYNAATAGLAQSTAFSTFGGASWITVAATWAVVAIIAIIAISAILGVGKTKQETVSFQCQPWQAPLGGADCSKCGSDGNPCTAYACSSLGQTCQLVNEGTSSAACININPNRVNPPVITPQSGVLPSGFSYTNQGNDGVTLTGPNGCLPSFTPITFGVSTDELSQCRFDTAHTNSYTDMQYDFGGSNLFTYNHTSLFNLPSLDSLGGDSNNPNSQANYAIYLRCRDKSGNTNTNEYSINFCVSPGIDTTAPIILRGEPGSINIPYNTISQDASIYTNEPADCKWSTNDVNYDSMSNQLNCRNNLEDQTPLGWSCSTTFPITQASNNFYIRCLDQPWLNVSDPANAGKQRNANTNSFLFNLQRTSSPLNITSLSPDGITLSYNVSPVSVNLAAQTSGGVDGTAICEAKFGDYFVQFFNTGGSTHTWTLNQFTEGDKEILVRCTDRAGNVAEKTAHFSIKIDTTAPGITRVYADENNGALTVVTDENSTCYYNTQSCLYNIDNATQLSGDGLAHTTSFNANQDYYLKCQDKEGNVPGDCSIIVHKGAL